MEGKAQANGREKLDMSLDEIIQNSMKDGTFEPIGNSSFKRNQGKKQRFGRNFGNNKFGLAKTMNGRIQKPRARKFQNNKFHNKQRNEGAPQAREQYNGRQNQGNTRNNRNFGNNSQQNNVKSGGKSPSYVLVGVRPQSQFPGDSSTKKANRSFRNSSNKKRFNNNTSSRSGPPRNANQNRGARRGHRNNWNNRNSF